MIQKLLRLFYAIGLGIALTQITVSAGTIMVAKSGGAYTTVQAGIDAASAGDTVLVGAGIYNELVEINKAIDVRGAAGAIIDGTSLPASGEGLVFISSSNVTLHGFEIRNFATERSEEDPVGIRIAAGISHVSVIGNVVHHITTSETSEGHNAFGIVVRGTSAIANTDINIIGNEVHHCKLGQSETIVVNGNIDGWVIANNYVHDNDNIGIVAIGFEDDHGPDGAKQARNGRITGNVIANVSTATNPTYPKDDYSAGGIYVDGGKLILIDGNKTSDCDIGIEVGCEHKDKTASDIIVRNNFISHSAQSSIVIGGWDAEQGKVANVTVVNNTTYYGGGFDENGEIGLQYYCSNVKIMNNILIARSGLSYIHETGGSNKPIIVSNNLYYGAGNSSPGPWPDTKAHYANPLLVNTYVDMHLQPGSPAINAGIELDSAAGSIDIDGNARVQGTAIDIGADEYINSTISYNISSSAGAGGTISPSGNVPVGQGSNQTFVISPNPGYTITSVNVNGASAGAVSSYTFKNIQSSQIIEASFTAVPQYTITVSAGAGGSISPSGSVTVNQGATQTFTITPDAGYAISSVVVNGVNIGAVTSYTFNDLQSSQIITASFAVSNEVDTNIAPKGKAYVWSRNKNATSNSNRAASNGLNDGNLSTNVSVYAKRDIDNGYEAAGIVFSTAKTISSVSFINGNITNGDGYLEAGLCLQISYNGKTWTSSIPAGWTLSSAYPYNASAAGKTYTFSGPSISGIKGIRVCGQVAVTPASRNWRLKEVFTYGH